MTCLLHQGRGVMSSWVMHIHPLAHILGTFILIFSSCTLFTVYHSCIMYIMQSYSSPVISHQSMGGWYKIIQEPSKKWPGETISICAPVLSTHSFHCHAASSVIPLVPRPHSHHTSHPNSSISPHYTYSTPFTPYFTHAFSPCVHAITILLDSLYLPNPFIFPFIPNPLLLRTLFNTLLFTSIIHLVHHISFTSSICCHLQPRY